MNHTLILKFSHNDAIAFPGKAAADFLKALEQATLIRHEYHPGEGYQWVAADPDAACKPDIEVLVNDIPSHTESLLIRRRLDEAEAKLSKHRQMIEAAEQLLW